MRAVVGLGNPGAEYSGTRHNVGFDALDELAARSRVRFRSERGYDLAELRVAGQKHFLVKPMTYMNRSGDPLRVVCAQHAIEADRILVLVDDFQLDLGRLRVRASGSHGGHNGLRSIIATFGQEFPRVRIGIGGPPDRMEIEEFVLSRFKPADRKQVEEMTWRAADAAADWLRGDPMDALMGRYNSSPNG